MSDRKYSDKKVEYYKRLYDMLATHERILVCSVDNVRSQQLHEIRTALRKKAFVVMGKNTLIMKVFADRASAKDATDRDKQMYQKFRSENLVKGNVGLVLTNHDLGEVMKIIEENKVQSPARPGAISPIDVIVPAGNTGLEPTQTSFFQALNIPTKIAKGTVELSKDVTILRAGQKVGASEAALLGKLKINPFYYGLETLSVYDHGVVYSAEVLKMSEDDKRAKVVAAVSNLQALALAIGLPTAASWGASVASAFSDVFALSLVTDLSFPDFGADKLKADILSGKASGPAAAAPAAAGKAAAAPAPAAKAAAAPAPAAEEEEEEMDMGGLFG